jgi:pyruvate/2-oxoglutarate dehydrogenase complex dihydrolipoamide acyltransferase (E2) component
MERARVTTWMKQEGDPVKQGDVLCVIESDKINFEIEAPESGVLAKVLTEEGVKFPSARFAVVAAGGGI